MLAQLCLFFYSQQQAGCGSQIIKKRHSSVSQSSSNIGQSCVCFCHRFRFLLGDGFSSHLFFLLANHFNSLCRFGLQARVCIKQECGGRRPSVIKENSCGWLDKHRYNENLAVSVSGLHVYH